MRKINKLHIEDHISQQLADKQNEINRGDKNPHWSLSRDEKHEIWDKLLTSQQYLCAYCECEIQLNPDKNFHIEHFYERHDFPDRIYDYDGNLILSCQGDTERQVISETNAQQRERVENISCGHKKSNSYHNQQDVDYHKLLSPMDDIEHLFGYPDGKMEAMPNCTEDEVVKINYTLHRLNLGSQKLNNRRLEMILAVEHELRTLPEALQIELVADLLNLEQEKLPNYFSAIKDNFEYLLEFKDLELPETEIRKIQIQNQNLIQNQNQLYKILKTL